MKKCPFCGEKIQNLAIKCRFCHEHLTEDQEAHKTKEKSIQKKDYKRIGIIGGIFYLIGFGNSKILQIGDNFREGKILRAFLTESQFTVALIFIIVGFIITKNKIIRRILGIVFGLSILYSIGISINYEQKETEKRMAILFSTAECQNNFGSGSHGDGTSKIEGGYNCYCNDGYTRNTENTKCITASESCNALYPGSISDGTKNENGGYNCNCPSNLSWNSKSTKCITSKQLCQEQYGKNAYSIGYFKTRSDGTQYTTCYY